jgi:hypothetical protein
MRQTARAEVRLDEGKATSSSTARRATRRFGFEQRQWRSNFVAARLDETENHAQQPGNLGDVGVYPKDSLMLLKWLLGEWNSLRLSRSDLGTEAARIEKTTAIRKSLRKQLVEDGDTQTRYCLSDLLAKVAGWEIRCSFPPLELLNDLEAMLPVTATSCSSIAMIAARANRFSLFGEPDSFPGQIRRLSLDSLKIATWLGLITALLLWFIISTSLSLTLLNLSDYPYRVMWARVAGAIVSVAIKTGSLVTALAGQLRRAWDGQRRPGAGSTEASTHGSSFGTGISNDLSRPIGELNYTISPNIYPPNCAFIS